MQPRVYGAVPDDLDEVRAVLNETFVREDDAGARPAFYTRYERCDPDFRPEQYRFRRLRGRIVSALKVYVRTLHHPDGPIPVTVIGGVCTRPHLRGRGVVGPVIEDAVDYSRSLGAKAVMIVTPRKNYYLRHGFTYVTTYERSGRVPELRPRGARIEPVWADDAGWMTEIWNAAADGYGPIVRTEAYTRKWICEMRLSSPKHFGFKRVRRGRPVGYVIFDFFRGDVMQVTECVSRSCRGRDEAALLSFARRIGQDRFSCHFPVRHPLIRFLREKRARLTVAPTERFMYYSLNDAFPIPDETFYYSVCDFV